MRPRMLCVSFLSPREARAVEGGLNWPERHGGRRASRKSWLGHLGILGEVQTGWSSRPERRGWAAWGLLQLRPRGWVTLGRSPNLSAS